MANSADRARDGRDARLADGDGRGDRQPRRNVLGHPAEQRGDIRRHARRGRKDASDRRRAACRSRSAACRSSCRAWRRPRRRWRRRTRRGRAPAGGRRRRARPDCPGAKLAPVIATSRPPSARRASAEAIWRSAASAMRPIDIRHRRERRVHQHDARRDAGVEMIVDLRGVEARDGDARKEMSEQRRRGSRPAR